MRCAASHHVRVRSGRDRKAVVPLPDLHIKPDVFCRAQDLLILYDDDPILVRPAELADLVREMLTEPHWSCSADPSIARTAHRPRQQSRAGRRRSAG